MNERRAPEKASVRKTLDLIVDVTKSVPATHITLLNGGRIAAISNHAERRHGFSSSLHVGRSLEEVFGKDTARKLSAQIQKAHSEQNEIETPLQIKTPNGKTRWFKANIFPTKLDKTPITHLVLSDITNERASIEALHDELDRTNTLQNILELIAKTPSTQTANAYRTIAKAVAELTSAEKSMLFVKAGAGKKTKYILVSSSNVPQSVKDMNIFVTPGEGFAGRAVKNKKPEIVADLSRYPYLKYPKLIKHFGAVAAIPIMLRDRVEGVLVGGTTASKEFSWEEINHLKSLADSVAVLLRDAKSHEQTKVAERKAREAARTDGLTGLHNQEEIRRRFKTELRKADQRSPLSVIMLDVDKFKKFNDQYGHAIGDTVLKKIAGVVKENTRETDHAGRFGGDEKLIVLPNTTEEDAKAIAERIRTGVNNLAIRGAPKISVTTGVSSTETVKKDDLAHNVDRAMQLQKKRQ